MAPPISNRWTTHPEYISLLNYVIEKTKDAKSPMSIRRIARELYEKNGAAQTERCLTLRIIRMRTHICSFEHIDTNTKVILIFALSASVDRNFLKELKKNAVVKVDDKKRITHYKANDESLELNGDHSGSAKRKTAWIESKRSLRSLFINHFKTKGDADAIPKNKEEKEMGNLFEFITENCENVDTPLSITQLATAFKSHFGISLPLSTIRSRIRSYRREIHRIEFLDTPTKVKQLFCLSTTVDSEYLENLRKNALVEVDENNRITHYKSNDGSLELRGDHSLSVKTTTGKLESKGSLRSLIIDYFENKDNTDAVAKNMVEEEMRNLIEFITEKCEHVNYSLSINQLAKDFNNHFGLSRSLFCIQKRIRGYCREIQRTEFLDTPSKVQQLFGLSATVNSDCLEKLRKDAVVEVDDLNRITKYAANDGSLALHGNHSRSAKRKSCWIVRRKSKKSVKKHSNSGGDENDESENENGYSEDESDEYSSEEFDSEFDSDAENDHLAETKDLMEPSNEAVGFDVNTPIRNRLATEMSIADSLDFDPPTQRSRRSEANEISEDQDNDAGIMANASVKTRHGRLSKRRHLDTEFSYNFANSRSSEASMNADSASSKPAKQKKIVIEKEQASNSSSQSRRSSKSIKISSRNSSFSTFSTESEESMENQDATRAGDNPSDYHKPGNPEIEHYDYIPREDNTPESHSIDNRIGEPRPPAAEDHNPSIEAQNTDNRADVVVPDPELVEEALTPQNNKNSTSPTNGEEVISQEVPIKEENEEPIIVEDHPEDVKPVTAHNPKIKFFEAMKSLILFLDTPSLSKLQSKIQQRIQKMKGSKEVLQNNELIPALELLVARIANHSVIDISKNVKSVSLIQFFCYLKASILNSKMIGVEGLMKNISELIEKSQNKRIPIEKVANALRATLNIDVF